MRIKFFSKRSADRAAENAADSTLAPGVESAAEHQGTSEADVPGVVLEELMVAFGGASEPEAPVEPVDQADPPDEFDFDDPDIDRLLGIGEPEPAETQSVETQSVVAEPAGQPAVVEQAAVADPPAATSKATVIVIADDDDLPDAVYLDQGDGDRIIASYGSDDTDGRSTIVIHDHDETGALDAVPVGRGGAIDPRLRARRVAVRRAEGRRRLLWVGVAAVIVVILVGIVALLASPVFDVERVDVQGAVYTDPVALDAVIQSLLGEPILLVDTDAAEAELESIPWVERARVYTDFPHRVVIDLRERQPVGTFAGADGRFRVIDRDGRVLDVIDGVPIAYVLITGDNPDPEPGQFAGGLYPAAAEVIVSLPPTLRASLVSVGVDNTTSNLTMVLLGPDGEIDVQLGGPTDLTAKLARLLQRFSEGVDGISSIDVSTNQVSTNQ